MVSVSKQHNHPAEQEGDQCSTAILSLWHYGAAAAGAAALWLRSWRQIADVVQRGGRLADMTGGHHPIGRQITNQNRDKSFKSRRKTCSPGNGLVRWDGRVGRDTRVGRIYRTAGHHPIQRQIASYKQQKRLKSRRKTCSTGDDLLRWDRGGPELLDQ